MDTLAAIPKKEGKKKKIDGFSSDKSETTEVSSDRNYLENMNYEMEAESKPHPRL